MSAPALEALTRLAAEPTPERLEEAAGEVLTVWWRKRIRTDLADMVDGLGILAGIAALPPLVACCFGVELRRRIYLQVPPWAKLVGRRDGEALAAEVESGLLRALWLGVQTATDREAGS
jgi:hypothetical protein